MATVFAISRFTLLQFFVYSLLVGCESRPDPTEAIPEPVEADATHDETRTWAIYHAFVTLSSSSSNAPTMDGTEARVHDVSAHIERADDLRRSSVDFCCSVLIGASDLERIQPVATATDEQSHYIAALGALYSDDDPLTPAGYFVERVWPLTQVQPDGRSRFYDGFESVDEIFDFVNGVPAAPLSGTSLEAFLNPPTEAEEAE